jgi:mannose-6-phosphate isomerase-like protein (cupin superfamily)
MERPMQTYVREEDIQKKTAADRWSKDLVGGSSPLKTTHGFNVGVAEYHVEAFGPLQVHDDQEAVYVISGVGEITVAGKVYPVSPGTAVYIPAKAAHATRRTSAAPVKLVYAHGAM